MPDLRQTGAGRDAALASQGHCTSGAQNVIGRNWIVDARPVLRGDGTGDGIQGGPRRAPWSGRTSLVRNADGGIDLESSGARLIRNLADDDGDLGIDALPGTFGAGNLASGNGNPAQCAGVTCG